MNYVFVVVAKRAGTHIRLKKDRRLYFLLIMSAWIILFSRGWQEQGTQVWLNLGYRLKAKVFELRTHLICAYG